MNEVLKPGMTFDAVVGQYVSKRLFIDIPTAQKAVQSMQAAFQPLIDGIKREIAGRIAEHEMKEDAVSNVLGGSDAIQAIKMAVNSDDISFRWGLPQSVKRGGCSSRNRFMIMV